MLAVEASLTVVDFETTGEAEGHGDEPWQIGLVRFERGRPVPDSAFTSLLRVGDRPFNPYAPGRHALVREGLRTAPPLPVLWPRLRPQLASGPLCAHNAATERKFMKKAFPVQRFGPWVDTLKLARVAYPSSPSHKLEDLTAALGLTPALAAWQPSLAAHDALYDAMACALLLEHLLSLPAWKDLSLEALIHARPGPRRRRPPRAAG